jgi:hypothetical protein
LQTHHDVILIAAARKVRVEEMMRQQPSTAATAALAGLFVAAPVRGSPTPSLLAAGLFLFAAFSWPAAGQAPRPAVTVFEGARLIVGDGSAVENAAFIVENGRFTAVGRNGEVAFPPGAARVDHRLRPRGCHRPRPAAA